MALKITLLALESALMILFLIAAPVFNLGNFTGIGLSAFARPRPLRLFEPPRMLPLVASRRKAAADPRLPDIGGRRRICCFLYR